MRRIATLGMAAVSAAVVTVAAGEAPATVTVLHAEWMDKGVDPLQDFYLYANGQFLRDNPVPPAYSSWGQFQILDQKNQDFIHELLQAAAADTAALAGTEERKIGDFYASGMDEAAVEKAGIAPLKGEFARIAAIGSPADLTAALAHLQSIGVDAAFGIGKMQDYSDSTQVIAIVAQGGLGLPDRDYYLKDDPKFAAIRKSYEEHIARMFVLVGDSSAVAAGEAHDVMALETRLAAVSMPTEDQRNPHAIYNIRDLPALAKEAPAIDWPRYLAVSGAPRVTKLNLAMPGYFAGLSHEIGTTPIRQWRNYLRWQLAHGMAPYLPSAFVDENFKYVQLVSGSKELLPRWRRVLRVEKGAIGFAVGHEYVKRRFPPEARTQGIEILHANQAA